MNDWYDPIPLMGGSGSPLQHSKAPRSKPLGLLAAHRRAQKGTNMGGKKPGAKPDKRETKYPDTKFPPRKGGKK